MRKFYLRVLTDKNLGDPDFVRGFCKAWFDEHSALAPDRYAEGEPVRKVIDPNDLDELLDQWHKTPDLMFKRVAQPKWQAEINWRKNKGKDLRPYPWGIKVWLNYKHGQKHVQEFFRFLINWFDPVYGYVTEDADESYKHIGLITRYRNGKYAGMAQSYWGSDIADTLPGMYWLTYISPRVIPADILEKVNDLTILNRGDKGRLIQLYNDPDIIGTGSARQIEKYVMDILGPEKFFDLDKFLKENNGRRLTEEERS